MDSLQDENRRSAPAPDLPTGDAVDSHAAQHALPSELLHDLRTPLNQIMGFSEMLIEQAQDEGQNDLVRDLHKIRAAGQQLLSLINNSFQTIEAPSLGAACDSDMTGSITKAVDVTASPSALHPSSTSSEAGEPLASGSSRGLILVVDDNEMNRDVLLHLLQHQGYDVALAQNGPEALQVLQVQPSDLVLLDIMMPEMDGYEVLQRLKADETLRRIPVLMISALSELDSVVRCIEMGAEDYLTKPFNLTLLNARIGACLEKKRGHDREIRLFEQLQQNYKRLKELEKLRDDLTGMIVHDLRTPLTSVMVGMQTLKMLGDLNEDQQELVDIAAGGAETLLGMINDLLDVEKMESGSMQLDCALLSAADLVASAVSQVAPLARSENLTLVQQITTDLPSFQGDENKLRRVLVNLLGNAIKFTSAGGMVTVAVRHSEDRRSLVFSVSDTGEGIPPEDFGRIFEKFGQVESRQRGRKMSTGLGLTFCKLAVEAHGGHIEVESAPNKGSTFSFTVPLLTAQG